MMVELSQKEQILKERAQKISRSLDQVEQKGKSRTVLEFLLASERYALDSLCISEVCQINKLTPLPCTPDFVMGIINLRGEILTVIDIKNFFSLPHKGITNLNRVIVVEYDGVELGILADEIFGERTIWDDELKTQVDNITKTNADFIAGVTSDRLIVLDIKHFLSSDRIVVDERIGS